MPPGAAWAAAVVVALGAYDLAGACDEVQPLDGGEFATLFAQGGVAHPSGYPLYVLFLRALRWMPGNPALASARATALLAVPAFAALYVALRAWGSRPAASLVGVVLFALGRVACEQFTQAEAFALNVVLCGAFLALSGPASPLRGGARVVGLCLVAGLGAAHHHTLATLAPLGLVALVDAVRGEGARARHFAWGALAFVAPLLVYLYPVWLARHASGQWIWGAPTTPRALLELVLRSDYWRNVPAARYRGEYMAALRDGLLESSLGVGLGFLAVGLIVLVVPRVAGTPGPLRPARRHAIALALSFVLAGPALLAKFPGYPVGVRLAIAERFFLLPAMLALVPLALGLDVVLCASRRPREMAAALVGAVALVHAMVIRPAMVEDRRPTGARYVRNVLRALPADAVIVGTGDLGCFGFLYAREAIGLRRDVVYVDVGMMALPWYRARIARQLGADGGVFSAAASGDPSTETAAWIEALMARRRAVFVAVPGVELPSRLRLVGHAGVMRVLPPTDPWPRAGLLEADNLQWMTGFEWDSAPVHDAWSWAGFSERGYRQTWESVAERYDAEGRATAAARMRERAARGAQGP